MELKTEYINGKIQTYIEKNCDWCGRIYHAKIKRQRFCSERCKKAESYARLNAKKAVLKPTKAQRRRINEEEAKRAILAEFMRLNGAFDINKYKQKQSETKIEFFHVDSHSGYYRKVAQ